MFTRLKVRPVGMPEITMESSKRWGKICTLSSFTFVPSMGNLATSSLTASQWVLSLSAGLTARLMPRSSHQRSCRQTLRRAASSRSSLQNLCGNATRPTKNTWRIEELPSMLFEHWLGSWWWAGDQKNFPRPRSRRSHWPPRRNQGRGHAEVRRNHLEGSRAGIRH